MCVKYTIHGDKTQMLKKFSSNKINGTKNVLFLLSRDPTHHSFTFNLRFLNELKHKIRLSKTVRGNFHFRFHFVLFKFMFLFSKMFNEIHGLFDFIIPFKIKIIEKPHTVLLQDLWFLNCNFEIWKFNEIFVIWSSLKTDLVTNF